jgi:hypothetical protein
MNDHLKILAIRIKNTPWLPMAGMPTNILNSSGLRVARCDFDGDVNHKDAIANSAYISAASPEVVLKLLVEIERLEAENAALKELYSGSQNEYSLLMQAITDPENQPSQFGTVTLLMYTTLECERDALEAIRQRSKDCINSLLDSNAVLKSEHIQITKNLGETIRVVRKQLVDADAENAALRVGLAYYKQRAEMVDPTFTTTPPAPVPPTEVMPFSNAGLA